ncbi:hypothetical protein D9M73_261290 [compost metagenome]
MPAAMPIRFIRHRLSRAAAKVDLPKWKFMPSVGRKRVRLQTIQPQANISANERISGSIGITTL